jgi:phenylacetate-CoA ligase
MLPRWLELPVYRARLAQAGLVPPGAGKPMDWHCLPFVSKRDMREDFPRNFLPAGQALESLIERAIVEVEHTSGTSEERTPVLLGRGWWDEQEARALRLNPLVARVLDDHPCARRAVLTTPTCNGTVCHTKWLPRAQRTLGQALYVNQARIPFVLKNDELARIAAEITEWAPQFLDLDPVHGAWFALYCERQGLRFPSLRFVLASYEFVSVVHRRILERVFGVPVLNLYGSTETGHLLMQAGCGAMRPSHENAFLELLETDTAGVGQLVVTTLTNDFMPLLRYRIGDLAARSGQGAASAYVVHGRARDALRRADGARITTWQVDQCFVGLSGVAHYQLRQAETGECRLRLLPEGAGLAEAERQALVERLENLLQAPGAVVTETVAMLLPAPSGKFRLTFQG